MMNMKPSRPEDVGRTYQKGMSGYTPPVYPVVDVPIPDLDRIESEIREYPWYIRLAGYAFIGNEGNSEP